MTNPKWSKKNPPPDWFFEIYDAIIQNLPVDQSTNIRQQPVHIRWRFRTVYELIKSANHEMAVKAKAMGVYDYAKHH